MSSEKFVDALQKGNNLEAEDAFKSAVRQRRRLRGRVQGG